MPPSEFHAIFIGDTDDVYSSVIIPVRGDSFQYDVGSLWLFDLEQIGVPAPGAEGKGVLRLAYFALHGLPGVGHAVLGVATDHARGQPPLQTGQVYVLHGPGAAAGTDQRVVGA